MELHSVGLEDIFKYTVGVVLCTYRRNNFQDQLKAIRGQSFKPTRVIVWRNDTNMDDSLFEGVDYVKASRNMGVWPRFSLCRDLQTDLFLVVDDDTIPGVNYLESCVRSYDLKKKVICANGFEFKGIKRFNDRNFHDREQIGWVKPNSVERRVDWPGHSWFFDAEVLQSSLATPRCATVTSGEDAHLAYSAQIIGQDSYAAAHPLNHKNLWGSLKGFMGDDKHATHRAPNQRNNMIESLNFYRDKGWKFIND